MQVACSAPKYLEAYVNLKPGDAPLRFPGRASKIGSHQTYVLQARRNGGHPDLVARIEGNDAVVTIDPDRPRPRNSKPRA